MAMDVVNGTINGTSGTINIVLEEIKKQNNITQKELAKNTNISLRTIKRVISDLKQNGQIKRIGSNKKGYWQILK